MLQKLNRHHPQASSQYKNKALDVRFCISTEWEQKLFSIFASWKYMNQKTISI